MRREEQAMRPADQGQLMDAVGTSVSDNDEDEEGRGGEGEGGGGGHTCSLR